MNLQANLLIGGIIATLFFGVGWKVNGWRYEAQESARIKEIVDRYEKQIKAAQIVVAERDNKISKLEKDFTAFQQQKDKLKTVSKDAKNFLSIPVPDSVADLLRQAVHQRPKSNP